MSGESDYQQRSELADSPSHETLKEHLPLNPVMETPSDRNNNPPIHVTYFDATAGTSTENLNALALDAVNHPTEKYLQYTSGGRLPAGQIPSQDVIYFEHDVVIKEDEVDEKNVELLLYRCNFKLCGFQSAEKEGITEHMKAYHGSDGANSGTAKSKEFQCDICQMKFTVFANMQRHRMSHLGVRPFECSVCNKKFTRNDHLMEHIVRQHSKQRPYKCPFCIKSFSVRPSLKNHLASDHSGIPKDKVCRVCGFRASTIGGAKIHYTNTHLRNSAGSESAALGENSATPMEQSEEVDLASVSQNFEFGSQEVGVPTSTANELDAPSISSPSVQSFRRYSSELHLPSCSTLGRPGPSKTNVSSSIKDKCQEGNTLLLCSSSGLKQEPVDLDSHNSCSSSAGTQPTSTIDPADTAMASHHQSNEPLTDEEDTEVGNHMASSEISDHRIFKRMLSRSASGNSDETTVIQRPARVERKPLINFPGSSGVGRYPDWRQESCPKSGSCGDSKVSTSMGNGWSRRSENEVCNSENKPLVQDSKNGLQLCPSDANTSECSHCNIVFPDSTMYFLHRGLHSDSNPWKCNYCGQLCHNKYDFYAHVIKKEHN